MRACRFTAAIAGLCLSIVIATLEAIAATNAIALIPGFRAWAVALIVVAVLAVCTLAVLEQQQRIADRLDELANDRNQRQQARAQLDAVQRRLNGNVHTLFPEE